jgi:translation initiation factor 3 subunit M
MYSVPSWQNVDFAVMFDIFHLCAVLKTKLVRARMDQAARKVYISSTMHRTFGRAQWQQLRDLLHSWKTNLQITQEGMKTVAAAQMDLLAQQ